MVVVHSGGKQGAWSLEQLLACGGFAGVLAWPDAGIDARALRRLQLAVAGKPVFAALWRPLAAQQLPSPAPLRIVLAAGEGGVSVRILKRRGRPASRPLLLKVGRPGRTMAMAPLVEKTGSVYSLHREVLPAASGELARLVVTSG
jgi:cell division inhibitor SulA/protein ImuA